MNLHGFVKKKLKPLSSRVNNKGFISIYGLMIISICLLFTTFMSQRIYTYAHVVKDQQRATLIDVFILHTIKQHLQQEREQEQEDTISEVIDDGGEEETQPQEEASSSSWQETYEGYVITFEQSEDKVMVTFYYQHTDKHIEVQIDPETKEIMNFVYIT